MSDPRAQESYQVRFAYGERGMRELAGADLVVIADELDAGDGSTGRADTESVVRRVLEAQAERGDRVSVAVIARGRDDVSFAVEDILAAGAVVDALAEAGIDHCSPEAAAVAAACTGLRHASTHLVRASVTARILRESTAARER